MMSTAIHAAQRGTPVRGFALARQRAARTRGFTVIEIMISLVVLAIIVALGAPALNNFVIQSRMTSQVNELLADISYARNEAATRGVRVGLCASTNSTIAAATCASAATDWVSGRIVFIDTSGDGTRDTSSGSVELLLKSSAALTGSSTLTVTSSSGTAPAILLFRPYGGTGASATTTFKICPNTSGKEGRQIVVAITGRPMVSRVGC